MGNGYEPDVRDRSPAIRVLVAVVEARFYIRTWIAGRYIRTQTVLSIPDKLLLRCRLRCGLGLSVSVRHSRTGSLVCANRSREVPRRYTHGHQHPPSE